MSKLHNHNVFNNFYADFIFFISFFPMRKLQLLENIVLVNVTLEMFEHCLVLFQSLQEYLHPKVFIGGWNLQKQKEWRICSSPPYSHYFEVFSFPHLYI